MPVLDPCTTALVLIDLQNGITAMPCQPHASAAVVAVGRDLAGRFRAAGAPVVLVRVAFAADFSDAPSQPVDQPTPHPAGGLPPGWSDLVEGLAAPGDLLVTKHQWGAFWGTDLDLQLRRRGVKTIVLAGIATSFGVESTARQAWEIGYGLYLVEDGCSNTAPAPLHDLAFRHVFPRLGRVTRSADLTFAKARER